MSFQDLPAEIISLVVHLLADVHPLSVIRLLRVNKRCFALALPVAKPLAFHTVRLPLYYPQLDKQVATLCAKLQEANALSYVRRLIIEGHFSEDHSTSVPPQVRRFSPLDRDPRDSYEFGDNDLGGTVWHVYVRETHEHHACWDTVAGFIKRLPALEDLHHLHHEQFPPCLLQTLHQHLPRCKLHLGPFVLRSIYAPMAEDHEYRLVTSPSLHSITPCYDTTTPDGMWQKQIFLRILSLAPNLKVVYPMDDHFGYEASAVGMNQRRSKFTQEPGDGRPAAIECLRIRHAYVPAPAAALEEWATYIDFSVLRVLDLRSFIKGEAFEAWADHLHFPALQTLRLLLGTTSSEAENLSDVFLRATRFLQSLPSLSCIYLEAWHSRLSIGTLGGHQGPRLVKLSVVGWPFQYVNEHDILQLGRYCPLLEKMSIPIHRTQGDAREVALYKALGTIRNLRFLDLVLDVSDPTLYQEQTSIDADWVDIDNQYTEEDLEGINRSRNGHIRRLLVNTLIDEPLASSIFKIISAAKPRDAPLLERMTLIIQGRARSLYVPYCKFSRLVRFLASEWTIKRDIRYEHY
ncbi:hypothetical protein CNMCM6069_002738 [Aspergillus lentulus]|nr:hypothetical protein CNMCM6069_002738 [Aspergillus lentulus]